MPEGLKVMLGLLMKTITGLAICFLLFPSLVLGQQSPELDKKKEEKKFSLGLELRTLSFDFLPNQVEVSNIPLQLRQVPVHPNDGYLRLGEKIVTIPADTIKPALFCLFSPSVSPQATFWRLQFRGGINVTIPLAPFARTANNGSTREIHQYNSGTSRGYGTSLVFYAVTVSPKPVLGWLGEAEFQVSENLSFLTGFSTSGYNLRIRTGWDRYDSLETYKIYKLSSSDLQKKYVGIRIKPDHPETEGSLLILGGLTSTSVYPVQSSDSGTNLRFKSTYFVAIALAFTFGK